MKIELISTGTELLTGKANTNAAYIGKRLLDLGFELSAVIDISDRKNDLLYTLKGSFERSGAVILTGGLGPTFDDITVETVAEFLDIEMYKDETVLKDIQDFFKIRNISYVSNNNNRQANIIRGAKVLKNKFGTAPGQLLECKYKNRAITVFLLPGPPREMQPLWEEYAQPYFQKLVKGFRVNKVISVVGLGESLVEEKIRPVLDETLSPPLNDNVEFGILAHNAIITVKFSVIGDKKDFVDNTANDIMAKIENILKDNIFSHNNESLENAVGKLLKEKEKTLSIAESCTGGLISQKVTDIAGSSKYFKGSVVSYADSAKTDLLGVKKKTLEKYGAVSSQTAAEMANGALKIFDTDYALSVTGIAGPDGGSSEKPVGLVYIGIASKEKEKRKSKTMVKSKTQTFQYNFAGSRQDIRDRTANIALNILRKTIC
ncbi:MAG: competence/damage-inducible protein A [Elusimicrobiota bacterium]|jgi:nicotinamide-nucleotide amidase|nr:competence/damage-inducible protein A [Elusimicrobiota bacterium]